MIVISNNVKKKFNHYDLIFQSENFSVFNNNNYDFYKIQIDSQTTFLVFGLIFNFSDKGNQALLSEDESKRHLEEIFRSQTPDNILNNIDGRFIVLKFSQEDLEIFNDRLAQIDFYYSHINDNFIGGTSLDELITQFNNVKYDQIALASLLTIYGNYAPRKRTIYKDIYRLGVGEKLVCQNRKIKKVPTNLPIKNLENMDSRNLEEYFEIISKSIRARISQKTNWIYLSSGWDSTFILAMLCHYTDRKNIRAVIARTTYSSRVGTSNQFEIDRATKVCEYFNVRLDILDCNYLDESYQNNWKSFKNLFKKNHLYSFFTYNFFVLSKFIKENGHKEDSIFNGEYSDAIHSLGFSQFASILDHQDLNFREYSDKMSSYLFGPSFFRLIEKDHFKDDRVYKIMLESKKSKVIFDDSRLSWKSRYAMSFFLSKSRIPFEKVADSKLLTQRCSEDFIAQIDSEILQEFVTEVRAENLYSMLINLYPNFHWQGSTVRGMMLSSDLVGRKTCAPFSSPLMIDFCSRMPEYWGRGLDFNRTKYPLKWILNNKIDYPLHLQTGPHSYLYDVDPNWNAYDDIIYGDSPVTELFKNILKEKPYKQILDQNYFNLDYIDELVEEYIKGNKVTGSRRMDLANIITLCHVGWYK